MSKTNLVAVEVESLPKDVLKSAKLYMRQYVRHREKQAELKASIAKQVAAAKLAETEAENALIELLGITLSEEGHIEETGHYPEAFDENGNLDLGAGYVHIANTAVITTNHKFNPVTLLSERPEWIDAKMKDGEIKKAFQDSELRAVLDDLGIDVDNAKMVELKAYKKS